MYVSDIIMIPNDPVLSFKIPLKKKKNTKSERLNWLKKERERESKREKEKKENGINKPKQGKLLRTF